MDDELEKAQAQAMELLLQQCVAAPGDLQMTDMPSGEANATLFKFFAQTCEDASAAVSELSVEDVAAKLAEAVKATQSTLRDVRASAAEILDDPDKVRELSASIRSADKTFMQMLHASAGAMIEAEAAEDEDGEPTVALTVSMPQGGELATMSDEDSVRNMMALADNMCGTMDHALSTITKDELDLAAQLSLGLAQKLLVAGRTLFLSLSKEERRKTRRTTRGDRITIEELPTDDEGDVEEEEEEEDNQSSPPREAFLHKQVEELWSRTREGASEHPYLAGALTAAGLPFIGLAIPVASIIGTGLVVEKYYPEHTSVALELGANFVQMSKLWFLLLKISARQLSVVARDCFRSWYEYASAHGFVSTGVELAAASCSLGWLGITYLYHAAGSYMKRVEQ